ncbi:MAG: hypothetical protein L0387_45845 [Acidobacteria bacterium]|nr:hypothetical protein [Acidobacteriota bacterium]
MRFRTRRRKTIGEEWEGWLPPGKAEVFAALTAALRSDSGMLEVALNEGLSLSHSGSPSACSELALVCAELFERLAVRLEAVLRTLYWNSLNFANLPRTAPLNVDFFRSELAKRQARKSKFLSNVLLSSKSRFWFKLDDLVMIVSDLANDFRPLAVQIGQGSSARPELGWNQLEVLDYDLSTCLAETLVVFKSFFYVLSEDDTPFFRRQMERALQQVSPAPAPASTSPNFDEPVHRAALENLPHRRKRNSST